ncbi:NAD-dependent epimerase/dehydratase family protein (plasmid) [Halolamina sp. CBA1230]|uniref:NAD-dependent epimerase/dehydratase family protein n=1 Tax=Halolamina sp. CBA1230 TaxID=1853690 RepID=UPI0009A2230B|nr:NAD-dependent epimerase/dehydratase family protein [Halolamina sp. CBA1230]QKY22020.1 NAD-dependent epimerase/dehydratase family protein [Halolamina sp. CBA1230]
MTDWGNQTVLVTGGAGFIGSFLTEELNSRGADVIVADNFSKGHDKLEHIADDVEIRPVDLTTHKGCIEATEGVDHVFHLAASVGGIHYIQRENIGGLTPSVLMNQHMLEAARINDIDRFLFASSACIYRQEHDDLNKFSEDQAIPANPHSTYGWAKILGEVACDAYHEDSEVQTSSVRIFNAYGPRENLDPDSSHVIPSLCRKAIEAEDGDSIELFGDGTQERGFIYVTDLVDGMIETMEKKSDGEPINLGNSKEVVSMNELAEKIIEISGKDLSIEHDLSMPTGTDKYAADMTKMKAELDWEPSVKLEDGLERVYEWAEKELEGTKQAAVADGGDT